MQYKFCPRCGHALQVQEAEDHHLRPVCPQCGLIVYQNPPIAAGVIAEREDGRIVLILRGENPGRGLWGLPAGFMEVDETLEAAARRECFEETGLQVELVDLWGVWSFYHEPKQTSGVVVVYTARVVDGEPRPGSDTLQVQFFSPDEIPFNQLAFTSAREALTRWVQTKEKKLVPPEGSSEDLKTR